GKPPFRRASAVQSIAAILDAEPAPLDARVPRHVAWLVERCLAKEPGDRYASTRDLARDLELALARLGEASPPAPRARPRPRAAPPAAPGGGRDRRRPGRRGPRGLALAPRAGGGHPDRGAALHDPLRERQLAGRGARRQYHRVQLAARRPWAHLAAADRQRQR